MLAQGWKDVNVELSKISIKGSPYVGEEITVSGTVIITSSVTSNYEPFKNYAYAESLAGFIITAPNNKLIDKDKDFKRDLQPGWSRTQADASQVYNWESTFTLEKKGIYTVKHAGEAYVWRWHNHMDENGMTDGLNTFYFVVVNKHHKWSSLLYLRRVIDKWMSIERGNRIAKGRTE